MGVDNGGASSEREYVLGDHLVASLHLHYVCDLDDRVFVGLPDKKKGEANTLRTGEELMLNEI